MSSFVADKIVMDGLTYDDVLLIPAYSEVLPKTVELQTKFSRNISLNVPFVTAAMDTVTESAMAIAIAREGGIGVIHKNMSIEDQARQVAIVKRAENGMIYDPVTIRRGKTVKDQLFFVCNFVPVERKDYLIGVPCLTEYEEIINSDAKIYGGSGTKNGKVKAFEEKCDRMPYAISIDIAPLSMMVFKYDYVDKKPAIAKKPAAAKTSTEKKTTK